MVKYTCNSLLSSDDDIPLKSLTSSSVVNERIANLSTVSAELEEGTPGSDHGNQSDDGNQSDRADQSQESQSPRLLFLSSSDEEEDKENSKFTIYLFMVFPVIQLYKIE